MKIDLTGQRAVVTGSTGGIGFAIAKALAEAGTAVVNLSMGFLDLNGRRPLKAGIGAEELPRMREVLRNPWALSTDRRIAGSEGDRNA